MVILYAAVLVFAALGAIIVFLTYRLTRTKEALFAARRAAVHAEARQKSAGQAAQVAEERCRQALGQLERSLAQTGQALDVAEHIRVVSQQLQGLTEYIADPSEARLPLQWKPGRHALSSGAARQAINSHPKAECSS